MELGPSAPTPQLSRVNLLPTNFLGITFILFLLNDDVLVMVPVLWAYDVKQCHGALSIASSATTSHSFAFDWLCAVPVLHDPTTLLILLVVVIIGIQAKNDTNAQKVSLLER